MSSRRPTSKDVAKLAGVSRTTVSFVLNNSANHSISEETAKRVRAAADKLGYMPFGTTRVLRKLRTNTVLVLARHPLDLNYPDEYRELLTNLLAKHQVSCLFAYTPADRNQLVTLCETVNPDAILLLFEPTTKDQENLRALGLPTLSLPTTIATQGSDAGVIAATHLFQRGSHKILFVTTLAANPVADPGINPTTNQASLANSFTQECLRGLHLVANAQTQTSNAAHPGETMGRKLVELVNLAPGFNSDLNPITALLQNQLEKIPTNQALGICTYSNQISLSILSAAKKLGVNVPSRLKLVLIGENQNNALTHPAVTTVSLNLGEQTRQITKQLLTAVGIRAKNINIEDLQPQPPTLTHRETS